MLAQITRDATRVAFTQILDTFTGADGGVSFVDLCDLVVEFDAKAAAGDRAAQQVLDCILKLARLIEIAQRTAVRKPKAKPADLLVHETPTEE